MKNGKPRPDEERESWMNVGEIRPGCRIVKKGEVYETKSFKPKKPGIQVQESLRKNMKYYYTDLINELVKRSGREVEGVC